MLEIDHINSSSQVVFGCNQLLPAAEPDLCHAAGGEHLCQALPGSVAALMGLVLALKLQFNRA